MTTSLYFLIGIVIVIPIIGFLSTISYARKADTAPEQRWRKGHGVFFWVMIPGALGLITILSATGMLPKVFSLISVIILACTTLISWSLQRKREE